MKIKQEKIYFFKQWDTKNLFIISKLQSLFRNILMGYVYIYDKRKEAI